MFFQPFGKGSSFRFGLPLQTALCTVLACEVGLKDFLLLTDSYSYYTRYTHPTHSHQLNRKFTLCDTGILVSQSGSVGTRCGNPRSVLSVHLYSHTSAKLNRRWIELRAHNDTGGPCIPTHVTRGTPFARYQQTDL